MIQKNNSYISYCYYLTGDYFKCYPELIIFINCNN